MRSLAIVLALLALAGCTGAGTGARNDGDIPAGRSDTRQVPSNYEPGVHVGGYVNIGIKKRF